MDNKKYNFSSEQIIANATLLGSLKGAKTLDTFAVWLLAGFGAALTFIIANIIPVDLNKLKFSLITFILATTVCVLQKYLAVIVSSSYDSSEETQKKIFLLLEKNENIFDNFDWRKYFEEIEKPFWPISKQIVQFFNNKLLNGDLNASARLLIHCLQAQSILVIIEITLLIICAWQVIIKISL